MRPLRSGPHRVTHSTVTTPSEPSASNSTQPRLLLRIGHLLGQGFGAAAVMITFLITAPVVMDHALLPDRSELEPTDLSRRIERLIEGYAAQYELDPALLKAVIKVESNFNPLAVSRKGALGLMQLMPRTASALRINNPLDPAENIRGGATQLRYLLDRFEDDLELALAAYHAGETRVREFEGIPPFASTQHYVDRVIRLYRNFTTDQDL